MEIKICSKCKEEKSKTEFYRTRVTKLHSWCKVCNKAMTLQRQRNFKKLAVEYKGGACEDCGLIDSQVVYDFHHLNPEEKDFSVSKFKGTSWCDRIEKELDKCVMLCSNCHRKRHSNLDN